jgi:DNA-binding NarL/FixJ family response regulator
MSLVADWFNQRKQARPAPKRPLRILVVAISLVDRILLEQLGKQYDWEIRFTNSPGWGFALASQSHFELILCDRNQVGYPWREVMGRLAAISPRSCILLVSPVNHDYLWRDVLQQGGYDVLARPMREDAVLHAVDAAIRFLSPGARFCAD